MKKEILTAVIVIIGIGYLGFQTFNFTKTIKEDVGQNVNQNLIKVDVDCEIDLTNLDSVRENLNGFWIPENNIDGENILWLDFHKKRNFSTWETIPYSEDIKRTKELPITSCTTIAGLIKLNNKVQMESVGLGGVRYN